MPLVKAYDEIENPRIQRSLPNGHFGWRSDFIKRPEDKGIDTPMAFLAGWMLGEDPPSVFSRIPHKGRPYWDGKHPWFLTPASALYRTLDRFGR